MPFILALFVCFFELHDMYIAERGHAVIDLSNAISFASALCNDLYIYNKSRDYSMKEIMDPVEEEGLFFLGMFIFNS